MSTAQLTRVTSARRQALSVFRINWRDVLYVITGLISAAVDRPFVRTQADRARAVDARYPARGPASAAPQRPHQHALFHSLSTTTNTALETDRPIHGVQYWTCTGGEEVWRRRKEETAATGKLMVAGCTCTQGRPADQNSEARFDEICRLRVNRRTKHPPPLLTLHCCRRCHNDDLLATALIRRRWRVEQKKDNYHLPLNRRPQHQHYIYITFYKLHDNFIIFVLYFRLFVTIILIISAAPSIAYYSTDHHSVSHQQILVRSCRKIFTSYSVDTVGLFSQRVSTA